MLCSDAVTHSHLRSFRKIEWGISETQTERICEKWMNEICPKQRLLPSIRRRMCRCLAAQPNRILTRIDPDIYIHHTFFGQARLLCVSFAVQLLGSAFNWQKCARIALVSEIAFELCGQVLDGLIGNSQRCLAESARTQQPATLSLNWPD